jgi:hypothetical protein
MTYNLPTPKVKEQKTFLIPNKKPDQKKVFLEEIKNRGVITEQELLLVKRRLNDGTYKYEDVEDLFNDNSPDLMPEQSEKGLKWLKNKGWGKLGNQRKNSPYGYREEETLKTAKKVSIVGFEDQRNSYQVDSGINNYQPIYRVEGEGEGNNFEYTVKGGEPYIIA